MLQRVESVIREHRGIGMVEDSEDAAVVFGLVQHGIESGERYGNVKIRIFPGPYEPPREEAFPRRPSETSATRAAKIMSAVKLLEWYCSHFAISHLKTLLQEYTFLIEVPHTGRNHYQGKRQRCFFKRT